MAFSVLSSLRFLFHLARDVVGTLRSRWLRWEARVVRGEALAAVGVDIFPFFENKTGVGWYEWNLLAALDRRQDSLFYNLYAHTFLASNEPAPPAMPGSERMRCRVHQLPPGFVLPQRLTIWLLRLLVEPLLRVLDDNDVLFAPNFYVPRTQLPFGRTVVATMHDMAFRILPQMVAEATLTDFKQHLPGTLFRAERLIAVSDATAHDTAEQLGVERRRIHTIHEGLDPCFAEPDQADELELPERYLLFVSTLEPRKNVINLLKAFRLLVEWGYPGQLVLVGRLGWKVDEIEAEMEHSPVRHRIEQRDYVDRAQLPQLYRRADALLFPSWLEGFGLPLLEAMACGTPVVTSGLSAMPEVAGSAAVYVDPQRPLGIASAVSSLLEDEQLRRRLVELGTARAARFSWDEAAAATAQVLRQAAGLPPTRDDEYRV